MTLTPTPLSRKCSGFEQGDVRCFHDLAGLPDFLCTLPHVIMNLKVSLSRMPNQCWPPRRLSSR